MAAPSKCLPTSVGDKGGCRLVYTEQGAYYGDENDIRNCRAACEELFGTLEIELQEDS